MAGGSPPVRWIAEKGVVLLSVAVALAVAEGTVRVLELAPASKRIAMEGRNASYVRSPNPALSYTLRPGLDGSGGTLVTNALGFRDIERRDGKTPGIRRVLLLGDSVVEGDGIADLHDTISRQWERRFPDDGVEVLNLGVSGYCTRSEVELLATRGLALEPDDAVLVFVENDFHCFSRRDLELGADRPEIVNRWFAGSALFRLACLRLDLFRFGTEGDPLGHRSAEINPNQVAEGLQRFGELCSASGVRPLVAIWPRFADDDVVDMHCLPGAGGRLIVEELASAAGVPTVRLSPYFRTALTEGGEGPRDRFTVGDGIHPCVEGSRVAAAALREILLRGRPAAPMAEASSPFDVAAALEAAGRRTVAQGHANRADALQAQGRIADCVDEYREALRHDPERTEWRRKLGMLLLDMGDLDAAARTFEEIVNTAESANAHLNLAVVRVRQGNPERGEHHYLRAIELDPDYVQARMNLGEIYIDQGRPQEAAAQFLAVLEREPEAAPAWNNLGVVLMNSGRIGEALDAFGRLTEIAPDYVDGHMNLAAALVRTGRPLEAVPSLRRAGRLDPEDPGPRVAAMWLLATTPQATPSQRREALVIGREALESGQGADPRVLDALAGAYAANGLLEEAQVTGQRALEACADHPDEAFVAAVARRVRSYGPPSGATARSSAAGP